MDAAIPTHRHVRGGTVAIWLVAILVAYVGAGLLGLEAAATIANATLIWPPAGIAIAATVLLGSRVLPVVWIGAYVLTMLVGWREGRADALMYAQAAGIATGNALEAYVAAWLIARVNVDPRLPTLRSVLWYLAIAGVAGPMVAATIGTASEIARPSVPSMDALKVWGHWMVGDALGAVTLGSALLSCSTGRAWAGVTRARLAEFAAMLATLAAACYVAFLDRTGAELGLELAYLPIPVVLWAALRYTTCGAAWSVVVFVALAVAGAVLDRGLFRDVEASAEVEFFFALYLLLVSATALIVAGLVTERANAMTRLREREERYRTLASATNDAVYEWDISAGTLWWGEGMTRLFGHAESEVRPTLDWWESCIHPEDRNAVVQDLERAVAECASEWESGYRFRRADGSYAHVLDRGVFLRDADGRATRMLGGMTDVTEKHEAELAISRAQSRERLIAGALRIVLWEGDPTTLDFTYVSDGAEALLGWKREEWLEPGFWMGVIHERDREWARNFSVDATRRGEGHEFEYRLRRRDGSFVWVRDIVAVEVCDGRPTRLSGVLMDITQIKRAQADVERSRRQIHSMIEHSPLAYIEWSPDFVVRAWSGRAEQIFGWSADEIVGRALHDWRFVYEDDAGPVAGVIRRLLEGEPRGVISRNRNVHKNGSVLHCEWYNWPVRDEQGNVAAIHSLVQDVTERAEAERRQTFMMQELDHRVKNNLAAILSLADATARASETIEQFRSAFTGRLRALARIHALLARSRWSGVRIGDLVRETLEPYADPAGPKVISEGPNALLPPRAASPLCMAMHELATNALKYGALSQPSGVVTLRWSIRGELEAPAAIDLQWKERGGPPPQPASERGFGSSLITDAIMHELGGEAEWRLEPDGLACCISAPLDNARPAGNARAGPPDAGKEHSR